MKEWHSKWTSGYAKVGRERRCEKEGGRGREKQREWDKWSETEDVGSSSRSRTGREWRRVAEVMKWERAAERSRACAHIRIYIFAHSKTLALPCVFGQQYSPFPHGPTSPHPTLRHEPVIRNVHTLLCTQHLIWAEEIGKKKEKEESTERWAGRQTSGKKCGRRWKDSRGWMNLCQSGNKPSANAKVRVCDWEVIGGDREGGREGWSVQGERQK